MFKKLFQRSKKPVLKNQVELCVSNRLYDSAEIDALLAREDLELIEVGCNSHCETCDDTFYALVNGEMVTAESAQQLIAKIDEELAVNSVV